MEVKEYIGEVWLPVRGYFGLYEVSNMGRVRVLDRVCNAKNGSKAIRKGCILKGFVDKWGYVEVHLYKDGKMENKKVHRLVAEAFIPNPHNYPCIDHINTIKTDNRVENLRWCTYKQNMNNPLTKERNKEKPILQKNREDVSRPVLLLTMHRIYLGWFPSAMEVERVTGIKNQYVSACCLGKQAYTHGFKFTFAKTKIPPVNWRDLNNSLLD